MKNKLKKLNIFLIVLCIIISSVIPTAAFAASEDDLRSDVVSIASGEVGYTGTSSYSKYGDWYGYQGGWCTTFVLWCFNKAGKQNNVTLNGVIIPRGGNCNSMISWFKDKGRYYSPSKYTPKGGDLIFFDWTGSGTADHVGIVNYTSGSTVYTIEGNCSGKVKAREYTKKGSKPYNNISSIIGYASPKFSSVSGSSAPKATTKKPTTTKKVTTTKKHTTTRKAVTTKKVTIKKATTAKPTTKKETAKSTTKKKTAKPTTTVATTTAAPASTTKLTTKATTKKATDTQSESATLTSLQIYASKYDLQVGDTVKLDYSVEPSNTKAVVGYFCDQEGIIDIGANGEITAVGNGTATVVVCANDDLYAQCDFTVTDALGEVTTMNSDDKESRKVVDTRVDVSTTQANAQSVLTRLGVNVNMLSQNKQLYIVPASIVGVTAFISIFIAITKKIKKKKK
ncbi:MAG: CHAP domain-containing protein [Eubacterium sp.]|nr:CHAP domain-containing protein [Eubacterium sp.]MDY4109536.1 CHAP domain-containing protein [Eubacterium sp.]